MTTLALSPFLPHPAWDFNLLHPAVVRWHPYARAMGNIHLGVFPASLDWTPGDMDGVGAVHVGVFNAPLTQPPTTITASGTAAMAAGATNPGTTTSSAY